MSVSVTSVTRQTGQVTYTLRNDETHRLAAVVDTTGPFRRDAFCGYVQDRLGGNELTGLARETALDAVAHYEEWARKHR